MNITLNLGRISSLMIHIKHTKKIIIAITAALAAVMMTSCVRADTIAENMAADNVWYTVTTTPTTAQTTTPPAAAEPTVTTTTTTTVVAEQPLHASAYIEDFPLIYQEPELPTGCEITAAAMLLKYAGVEADKRTLAVKYLPTLPSPSLHTGSDGRTYGADMESFFIGDPTTDQGYVCGVTAIMTALNKYLSDKKSNIRPKNISGSTPTQLYAMVDGGTPVMVWVTVRMEDRSAVYGWYRDDGVFMDWSRSDHGAVLIGYDENTVTIADPISGIIKCAKTQFERIFEQRGNKCLILESITEGSAHK